MSAPGRRLVAVVLWAALGMIAAWSQPENASGAYYDGMPTVLVIPGPTYSIGREDKGLPGDWPVFSNEPAMDNWSPWATAKQTHHVGFRSACSMLGNGKAMWTIEAKNGPFEGDGWHFLVFDQKRTEKADLPPAGAVVLNLPAENCQSHPEVIAVHDDPSAKYDNTMLTYKKNEVKFKSGSSGFGSFFTDMGGIMAQTAAEYTQEQAGMAQQTSAENTQQPNVAQEQSAPMGQPAGQQAPAKSCQASVMIHNDGSRVPVTVEFREGDSDTVAGSIYLGTDTIAPYAGTVLGRTSPGVVGTPGSRVYRVTHEFLFYRFRENTPGYSFSGWNSWQCYGEGFGSDEQLRQSQGPLAYGVYHRGLW